MKTIKDIFSKKKESVTTRNTLFTYFVGGPLNVNVEKFEIVVCGYSKIKEYRRQQNGFKPTTEVRYRVTYDEGRKRLTKDFRSLVKMTDFVKKETSKVEMGVTTMEVM